MNNMEHNPVEIDEKSQEKAKAYARVRRYVMIFDLVFGLIYFLVWLFTGWSWQLKQALVGISSNEWFLVFGFACVFGGVFSIVHLPLSFYSGYVLPHKFDLSTQDFVGWIVDQIKGLFVSAILGLLIIEVAYAIFRHSPEGWWLWLSAFMLFFNVVLANLAPLIIFPLFFKFAPLPEQYVELGERLLKLAERTNTKVSGVYTFDMSKRTKEANAALVGLGNSRRIIIGDTLLESFTSDEVETVFAHELGHHVHQDMLLGIGVQTIITLVGFFLASKLMMLGNTFFGFAGVSDVAAMPLLGLVLGFYGILTMPLENTYLRWRETLADQYALNLTGKGEIYASALKRLANQNLAEIDPEPWVEFLFYSHPSLKKRIRMALEDSERESNQREKD